MRRNFRSLGLVLCAAGLTACEAGADARTRAPRDTVIARTESASGPTEASPLPDSAGPAVASMPATESADPPAGPSPATDSTATPTSSDAMAQEPPQEDGIRLLTGAAARYGAIRSMRADFVMEARNPLLRESIRSRGELFQRRPDRILLRFEEPAGDIIVSDGRYIWVWYPSVDSAQVIRTPAAAGAGGVDLLAQFVGDPTERFSWRLRASELLEGRSSAIIVLDPRGDEAYRQLVVWIDREDFLVRRFEVTEHSGLVRRIDLTNLVIDPDLPDTLFRFVPPAGARIVGQP